MTLLAGGLLAIAAGLVGVARRTHGRPPLWRSWAALAGAVVCLIFGVALVVIHPSAMPIT